MIRPPKPQDLTACVDLAIEYFEPFLKQHGVPVIREDVERIAKRSIKLGQMLIIENDNEVQGIAAWEIISHPANSSVKIFYETIWCVKSKIKTDALVMLRGMESKARQLKADIMVMANLATESEEGLRKIFTKMGFTFMETHYAKELNRR